MSGMRGFFICRPSHGGVVHVQQSLVKGVLIHKPPTKGFFIYKDFLWRVTALTQVLVQGPWVHEGAHEGNLHLQSPAMKRFFIYSGHI